MGLGLGLGRAPQKKVQSVKINFESPGARDPTHMHRVLLGDTFCLVDSPRT